MPQPHRHYGIFASGEDAYRIETKVDAVLAKLGIVIEDESLVLQMETTIMADLTAITATAERTETTIDSAIVVINSIADRIAAAIAALPPDTDTTALANLETGLRGRADALAFAIDADAHGTAPVVAPSVPN